MKYVYSMLCAILMLASCKEKEALPTAWTFARTIQLDGVYPIGIAEMEGKLWLSDGDNNRLVQIDKMGRIEQIIDSLDRPMHLDAQDGTLFVPLYGTDNITIIANGSLDLLALKDSLDAPAGFSIYKSEKAIADFYNNRILYQNGSDWISFGNEGKAEGEFYYPTDVQITDSLIWVADAYNNRVQVFDKTGNFLKMMGQDQKMNAATGIFVSETEVFVSDFENDRILIFDMEGGLKQELSKNIEKATDMLIVDNELYVINYRNGQVNIFELKEIGPETTEQALNKKE